MCDDDRLPVLFADAVIECGRLSRAGQVLGELPTAAALGFGAHTIVQTGVPSRRWSLRDGELEEQPVPTFSGDLVAPPATDDDHAVLPYADHIEIPTYGQANWPRVDAKPLPGAPPALAWPVVVWTEWGDGLDLWTLNGGGLPVPFATGPGDQHHPVGAGGWLAYVDQGEVVRVDPVSGQRERFAADSGFDAPPALTDSGELCWEDRANSLTVRCTLRGAVYTLPEALTGVDPGWPSRVGDRVLVHGVADVIDLALAPW